MNFKLQKISPYSTFIIIFIFSLAFGLFINTPKEILTGYLHILQTPDILLSDNIAIGGIGSAMLNAVITTGFCLIIVKITKTKPNGAIIMALWLVLAFSFIGKNIINITPIILGVYLYSLYRKDKFSNYLFVALLGTALSPVVTQLSYLDNVSKVAAYSLGVIIGIFVGFILPPIASYTAKVHSGYNLYNIGFASGLIGTLLMSFFRGVGINFDSKLIWSSGNNFSIALFLFGISFILLALGLILGNNHFSKLKDLNKQNGHLNNDFYLLFDSTIYLNMAILCSFCTLFVLLIGGDLNGGTICGILTVVGFGSFGKTIKNIIPVMIGATLAGLFNIAGLTSPSVLLAILFSTCLAPISGTFGILAGVLVGIVHVNIAINTGYIHGGLTLYNNGFAGGLTIIIMLPLITAFQKKFKKNKIET
ncbi:MAG: DUF1576 domain-containing protein [Sarcina sp.]